MSPSSPDRAASITPLTRLEIRDLVVIAGADLRLGPGLTAITGETGAGKTVLATALGLLAGAPADASSVRTGASHALVQAEVALPDRYWDRLEADDPVVALRDLADDPQALVVARRIPVSGRARALVDGQVAARSPVAELVRSRLRFSGQHEQRRLTGAAAQMEILDGFAGPAATGLAAHLKSARGELATASRTLASARAGRDEAMRERAALEDMLEAVDQAGLDPAEEQRLLAERGRLANLDGLARAVATAVAALSPEDDDGGAIAATGAAQAAIGAVIDSDPALAEPLAELVGAADALQGATLALSRYLSDLESAPGAIDAIEERLDLYQRLSRRYGPGTEQVLARAEEARERLALLDDGEGALDALGEALASCRARAYEIADELGRLRAQAAPRLEEAVRAELAELAMPSAEFEVLLEDEEGDPPRQRCRFMLRVNPGLPAGPLAQVASGGELSRVLLALHGVAAAGSEPTAWVFDEVDAGIGGVTAVAVAARLRALAASHQVLVITHLPQVAALADAHFRLVKEVDGELSTTRIEPLEGEEALLAELCRMLGASSSDAGARRHAQELLARRLR